MSSSSGKSQTGLDISLNRDFIEKGELLMLLCWLLYIFRLFYLTVVCVCLVTDEYNESLVFSPDDSRLFYSIREPIVNRVFSSSQQRGFASKSVSAYLHHSRMVRCLPYSLFWDLNPYSLPECLSSCTLHWRSECIPIEIIYTDYRAVGLYMDLIAFY